MLDQGRLEVFVEEPKSGNPSSEEKRAMTENVTKTDRQRLHGRVAALTRSRPATDLELMTLRRQLKMIRIADAILDRKAGTLPVQLDDADIARVVEMLRNGA